MPPDDLASLKLKPLAPGEGDVVPLPAAPALAGVDVEDLLAAIDSNVGVFKPTGKPEELFSQAAEAVRKVVGLDAVCVLLWREGAEEVVVTVGTPHSKVTRAEALRRVREGRTVFASGESIGTASRLAIEIVAAAPLMGRSREVIGAVYGERALRRGERIAPVTRLEAILLQQLARELSLALDRLREEEESRRELSRMTSFMSEEQARAVLTEPAWADGREPSVTVLFCDIVGFTGITKSVDTKKLFRWSGAVLDMLTRCVSEEGGTLIDYTGDGLSALWGAPIAQTDQARRACAAAVKMVRGLGAINAEHEKKIHEVTRLRIGLNTGEVRAGNIGSERFKKFGAHGTAINLGRRIESAAKFFKCPVLMGEATMKALQLVGAAGEFSARRLARVRVFGVNEEFDVYELDPEQRPDRGRWRDVYEEALRLFETGRPENLKEAGHLLGEWRKEHDWDQPSLVLLWRIVNAAVEGKAGDRESAVVRFTEK